MLLRAGIKVYLLALCLLMVGTVNMDASIMIDGRVANVIVSRELKMVFVIRFGMSMTCTHLSRSKSVAMHYKFRFFMIYLR